MSTGQQINTHVSEKDPARSHRAPTTAPIAGALMVDNRDGIATLNIHAGSITVTLTGAFSEVRDELERLWRALPATEQDRRHIASTLWSHIISTIQQELPDTVTADQETTVGAAIDEIHGLLLSCSEWDDGWFPSPSVNALDADGQTTSMTEAIADIFIDGLNDGIFNTDLRELNSAGFSSTWEFILPRPV